MAAMYDNALGRYQRKIDDDLAMESAMKQTRELKARIRELEAELDALKSDLSGYMNAANTYVNELHGVHTGTHAIVPVEPTPKMQKAGFMAKDRLDSTLPNIIGIYSAMIRAAQPERQQGE